MRSSESGIRRDLEVAAAVVVVDGGGGRYPAARGGANPPGGGASLPADGGVAVGAGSFAKGLPVVVVVVAAALAVAVELGDVDAVERCDADGTAGLD